MLLDESPSVDHLVLKQWLCALLHSEVTVLIILCKKATYVLCLFQVLRRRAPETGRHRAVRVTQFLVWIDGGISCRQEKSGQRYPLFGGIRLMMCKNSHLRIFSNHRNALGSGQEECNRRAVSAGLCLWGYARATVDYVFGSRLHCCLPPGNMKWFF